MTARIPVPRRAVRTSLLGAGAVTLCLVTAACGATPIPGATDIVDPATSAAYSAAEATYRAYLDALNTVDLADPASFEDVFAYTTVGFAKKERSSFERLHEDGATLSGRAEVARVAPVLTTSDFEGVTIAVCTDVSAVTLTSPTGESLVPLGRPDVQSLAVDVVAAPDSATGYRITNTVETAQTPPC